jgi:hypothetical protein
MGSSVIACDGIIPADIALTMAWANPFRACRLMQILEVSPCAPCGPGEQLLGARAGVILSGIMEAALQCTDIESEGGGRSTLRVSLPAAAASEGGMIDG